MKFNNVLPAVALIAFSTIVIALRRSKTGVSRVSFPKPIPYRVSFSPTPTKFNTTSYSCEPNLQSQPRPIQPRKGAIHEIENLRLKLPPDSIYSKLKLTYDRIVLPESNCQDVFISLRTAASFHKSRLPLLLYTWLQTVNPKQVQILTDFANDTWINAAKVAVLRANPIPFRSADRFQYQYMEEGSGDLGPLYVDLYGNLNRANEIAEHIIRADFVT